MGRGRNKRRYEEEEAEEEENYEEEGEEELGDEADEEGEEEYDSLYEDDDGAEIDDEDMDDGEDDYFDYEGDEEEDWGSSQEYEDNVKPEFIEGPNCKYRDLDIILPLELAGQGNYPPQQGGFGQPQQGGYIPPQQGGFMPAQQGGMGLPHGFEASIPQGGFPSFSVQPGNYGNAQGLQSGVFNQGTYPGQNSYPPQNTYPGQNIYPGQNSYPAQTSFPGQGSYPGQNSYPGQAPQHVQSNYPGQSLPGQNAGYPGQTGYPGQQGYPSQGNFGNQGGYQGPPINQPSQGGFSNYQPGGFNPQSQGGFGSNQPQGGFNSNQPQGQQGLGVSHNSIPAGYTGPDHDENIPRLEQILPRDVVEQNSQKIMATLSNAGSQYVDHEFNEQTNRNVTKKGNWDPDSKLQWNDYKWKRLPYLKTGTGKMYSKIEPNNIVQGALGTCYFLCSLSSLAERPAFIKRLLDSDNINPSGAHAVWLNLNGMWKQILIDDTFPVNQDDSFALGSARDPDRWVNFVEKAYAKAFGSYQIIDGGYEIEALRDLTGAPYETIDGDDMKKVNPLWKKLKESDQKGYVMVCSINNVQGASRETKKETGLFGGHAYSLIACAEVPGSDGRQHRIVQVRNPWGDDQEWNGLWSDKSPIWTPQAKQIVNHKAEADGTFWITIEDFSKNFAGVGICKVHANFYFNSIELHPYKKRETEKQEFVMIDVPTAGKYYFSVDQQDTRLLSATDPDVQYDSIRVTISRVEGDSFRHVGTTYGALRNISVKCTINPGKYMAIIDFDNYNSGLSRPIVFSSYGSNIVGLAETSLTVDQKKQIEHMTWRDYGERDSLAWQNAKNQTQTIRQNGVTVNVTKQMLDKTDEFGLKLVRYQVQNPGVPITSALSIGGGKAIQLGEFRCEVEVQKEEVQEHPKLTFKVQAPGQSGPKGAKVRNTKPTASLAQTLMNIYVPQPTCTMPPSMNPFLQRRV